MENYYAIDLITYAIRFSCIAAHLCFNAPNKFHKFQCAHANAICMHFELISQDRFIVSNANRKIAHGDRL